MPTCVYLGGDDEERGLLVEIGDGLGQVGAVDVGDEVDVWTSLVVRLEGLCHHEGALVRKRGKEGGKVYLKLRIFLLQIWSICTFS